MPSSERAPSVADEPAVPDDTPPTAQYSLSRAVHARRKDYTRPHRIRIKIGTWNVAASPGTDKDLASWFVDGEGLETHTISNLAELHLSESSVGGSQQNDTGESSTTPAGAQHNGEEPSVHLPGGDKIGLYVLGLQEVVSLNLVQQSLYTDSNTTTKWKEALEAGLPQGYQLVTCQQLVGLLLLIYASPEVAATISNESTVSVGTGLLGYMGNKGAVSSRILLGETTSIVFANCHLSSGHDENALGRRCWDYSKILSQTRYTPINIAGVEEDGQAKIGDEDYSFLFGDLNFRLDGLPGDDIKRILTLHTTGEYDLGNHHRKSLNGDEAVMINHNSSAEDPDGTKTPGMVSRETSFNNDDDDDDTELPDPDEFVPDPHDDPASLQATLDSLLPHDQLGRVIRQRKALHEGWREGPITFLPTYKYDVGTMGHFDSSEKKRAPSWCDRILFRTRKNYKDYEAKVQDEAEARKKDEEMQKRGLDTAADDESVLFDYDPSTDIAADTQNSSSSENLYDYDEYDEDGDETAAEPQALLDTDEINLEVYTSHHRITSSDHKPLTGIFTLDYEAVVPELKARVHAEVAKELDRAENEGRPGITIVADGRDLASNGGTDSADNLVDFGRVAFLHEKVQSLTIANTGGVSASFNFVENPGNEDVTHSQLQWLHTSFSSDNINSSAEEVQSRQIMLQPGETISVTLRLYVRNLSLVRALNAGTAQLEDVLVLRVDGGRDHFIPVRASWRPTCFGRSLEELIRIPHGGIRGLSESKKLAGSIPSSFEVQKSSPAELYKLTEAIESLSERAVADENMLDDCKIPRTSPGWPFCSAVRPASVVDAHELHLIQIIEALEEDKPVLEALNSEVPTLQRLEAVCEVLVLFLRSMPDGIITSNLWSQIESALPDLGKHGAAIDVEQSKTFILDILATSPYNNISFVFLTSMLSKVAGDVVPLGKAEAAAIVHRTSEGNANIASRTIRGAIGVSRGLSFRRNQGPNSTDESKVVADNAVVERRMSWEKKAAEILGAAMCRPASSDGPGSGAGAGAGAGEGTEDDDGLVPISPMSPGFKKVSVLDRMAGMVEIFFRRDTMTTRG